MAVEFVRPAGVGRWLGKTRPESSPGKEVTAILQAGGASHSWWKSTSRRWFALDELCQVGPFLNFKMSSSQVSST